MMLIDFFFTLRQYQVKTSLREFLDLLAALQQRIVVGSVDDFYQLARLSLVKDETEFDKFDRAFSHYFRGISAEQSLSAVAQQEIPTDWIRKLAERFLTAEEKARVKALGGFEELIKTLKERLQQQQKRHQGGHKWIGTAGTSPFGAYGYNPEGIRIGQAGSRHRRAVKVWDQREFQNLDGHRELGTRNMKVALRRLRRFVREGAASQLDLDGTIRSTVNNAGWLDLKMQPERHNAVKVLLFMDVGGSMDDHVRILEELFTACRSEFKHLHYYYFHNCPYEAVWQDNNRRQQCVSLDDVVHRFGSDYRLIFVGDASMSPYEILYPGGSVEHWNELAGAVWLEKLVNAFTRSVWLNPVAESDWAYVESIAVVSELVKHNMFPLTLNGLEHAMRVLR